MDTSQHPSLALGHWLIPGPLILIFSIGVPLLAHARSHRHYSLTIKTFLEYTSVALHLPIYIYIIRQVLHKSNNQQDNITLSLLEYTSPVLGEAILKRSNFWLYTSIAVAWMLILPRAPGSQTLSRVTRAWSLLAPTGFVVLQTDKQLSTGARVSILSLLTMLLSQIWSGFIASTGSFSTSLVGQLFPIVVPICILSFCHTEICELRCMLSNSMSQTWLRTVSVNGRGDSRVIHCIRCAEFPVARVTIQIAGSILSSFLCTCLRWRWLLSGEESRPPAWTGLSVLIAMFFFNPILLLIQTFEFTQGRNRAANLGEFIQRQIASCMTALWWTNCIYVVLWLVLEILRLI
jgi:hypothetical protein